MSLTSSMFAGVGGLFAYGQAMNVIGDNIANVNTVGFKSSRPIFSDLLATSVSGSSSNSQIGHGSILNNVNLSLQQGSTETTGNATDMAIQGSGFFIVGGPSSRFYTRGGQFILNEAGMLVNPNGDVVQGYDLDVDGNIIGNLGDVDLAGVQSIPSATTSFRLGANLDATASGGTTFQTAINLYNSLGELTTLSVTFTKSSTVAGTWDYGMTATSETAASGVLTITGGTGTMTFDSTGALIGPATEPSITISGYPSGGTPLAFVWDLLTPTGGFRSDLTSYAANSSTNSITQDGYSTGTLKGISVNTDGVISGLFSNGQTQSLIQLGLADFLSPWGLTRTGNSLFAESAESGQPIIGTANGGGFGSIIGNALELSNVDLASEFVSLIQNQRAYQANSRIITTVDEMLAETVNLKR